MSTPYRKSKVASEVGAALVKKTAGAAGVEQSPSRAVVKRMSKASKRHQRLHLLASNALLQHPRIKEISSDLLAGTPADQVARKYFAAELASGEMTLAAARQRLLRYRKGALAEMAAAKINRKVSTLTAPLAEMTMQVFEDSVKIRRSAAADMHYDAAQRMHKDLLDNIRLLGQLTGVIPFDGHQAAAQSSTGSMPVINVNTLIAAPHDGPLVQPAPTPLQVSSSGYIESTEGVDGEWDGEGGDIEEDTEDGTEDDTEDQDEILDD